MLVRPWVALALVALLLAPAVGVGAAAAKTRAATASPALSFVREEAQFILSTQFRSPGHPAHGAFNDVPGAPTWVVPRENGVAILGLLKAASAVGGKDAPRYREAAALAADYLVRVQRADGAWADQYDHATPVTLASSPTQTAEVLIALGELSATPARTEAMRRGAEWLLQAQAPANKEGPYADDGLVNGGTGPDGAWHGRYRFASDNAFAAAALRAAGDRTGDPRHHAAASRVLAGIDHHLKDPASPGWHRRVDGAHVAPTEPADWLVYAPAFVGVRPTSPALAAWVDATFGRAGGAVSWESREGPHGMRLSPGYSFQACAVWTDAAGARARCDAGLAWADGSGLRDPAGGWIDWVDATTGERAPRWQRFVDTSAYSIAARLGVAPFA